MSFGWDSKNAKFYFDGDTYVNNKKENILGAIKEVLLSRIEHEYTFHCTDFVINDCF